MAFALVYPDENRWSCTPSPGNSKGDGTGGLWQPLSILSCSYGSTTFNVIQVSRNLWYACMTQTGNAFMSGIGWFQSIVAGMYRLVSALSVVLGACVLVKAQELDALSRILVPAYTAMNYASLCSVESGWAGAQPRGVRGAAINYAQHVKDDVIASLSENDAVAVLKMAADIARNNAQAQLRDNVIVADKTLEALRFHDWCNSFVNGYIVDLIRRYDGDYDSFMRTIEQAKSPR
jgi:hypothetical protein